MVRKRIIFKGCAPEMVLDSHLYFELGASDISENPRFLVYEYSFYIQNMSTDLI